MTTSTSLYRRIGAREFPSIDTDETTLASLDPARDIVLELLAAAINDELGPRWADAIANTPRSTSSNPVESKHPFPPSKAFFEARKVAFPALFVARVSSTWGEQVTEHPTVDTIWKVAYVLGDLAPGSFRKLADAMWFASDVMRATLIRGGHPAYAIHPNAPSGTTIPHLVLWRGDGLANFTSITPGAFEGSDSEVFAEGDDRTYYASGLTFTTTERYDTRVGHGGPFSAVDFKWGVAGDGGTVPQMVQAQTDVPYQDG